MTLRDLLDNQYSQDSRLLAAPGSLFLASVFLVMVLGALPAPIAHASDESATTQSVLPSSLTPQCNLIDCFGNVNVMERRHRDFLPAIQSINMQLAGAREFNEDEFLLVSATPNTANMPSVTFKTERWHTNKAVIVSSIFEAVWLTADGITTAGMSRGASEAGSVWAYGRHPTPGRTAAMTGAEFVGVEVSSYVLHKMKAPKWIYIAPMIVSGSLHASGAIPNIRIGQ